jgi:hypothetical protein
VLLLTDDAVGVGRQEGSLDPSVQGVDDDASGLHQEKIGGTKRTKEKSCDKRCAITQNKAIQLVTHRACSFTLE